MIPEKLSMHSFMSYRDNVHSLYFDGIHTHAAVAAMAIVNQHCLMLFTWALWGKIIITS
jgi:hypothetical protein